MNRGLHFEIVLLDFDRHRWDIGCGGKSITGLLHPLPQCVQRLAIGYLRTSPLSISTSHDR